MTRRQLVSATRTLLALILIAVVGGCGGRRLGGTTASDDGVDEGSKTITIGATAAKTGPAAAFYESSLGAQAYVAKVNAAGGVNGWKLKYIVLDDGYEPTRAVDGVKRMVEQDRVFALVSMFGTPSNAATMPYVVQRGIPDVGFSMQTGIIAHKYPTATNLFGYIPPYANLAAFVVHYLATQRHDPSISFAYQDDDAGAGALAGVKHQAGADHIRVAGQVPVATGTADFAGYAGRLAAAKAPSVFLWMPPAQAAGLIKATAAVGYKPHWVAPFFTPVPTLFDTLGKQAEGMEFESWLQPLDSKTEGMQAFLAAMRQHTQVKSPSINAELGWLGMGVFVHGLERATAGGKAPSREGLMSALNDGQQFEPGQLGVTIRYGGGSRIPGATRDRILRYQGGRLVTVIGPAAGPTVPQDVLR
jgi:branched-chain amino acid transport system substrate-binding protein